MSYLWAFKGISNVFCPEEQLSSLTRQNDRVQTSNAEQKPLHHIHPGSKRVYRSSVSLSSRSRSIDASHMDPGGVFLFFFLERPPLCYRRLRHLFLVISSKDLLLTLTSDLCSQYFLFVAEEVEAEEKNIIQQPWARCVCVCARP